MPVRLGNPCFGLGLDRDFQESEETRMIRRISSVAAAAVVTLTAAGAWAQAAPGSFGTSGQFAIGAERMFGYVHTTHKVEREAAGQTTTVTDSASQFSFLGMHGTDLDLGAEPMSHPRIGLDYFVIDRLSVGGSLIFMSRSTEGETETQGQTLSGDGPSTTAFIFNPRVGYAFMFSDMFGIWPRGGFTYYSISQDLDTPVGTRERSENGLALTLEAMFVITPIPHMGFTVGPTLDLGLTGGRDEQDPGQPNVEADAKITDIGLNAGALVWF